MKLKAVKANTKLTLLRQYQIVKIIEMTFEWCYDQFGRKKYCPNVDVYLINDLDSDYKKTHPNPEDQFLGWYKSSRHNPKIVIVRKNIKNILLLVDTIIHEYTHHLQINQKLYFSFSKQYSYFDNPFEADAIYTAEKHRMRCINDILKNT